MTLRFTMQNALPHDGSIDTLHPKPYILNPTACTRHPKPETLHTTPLTLNSKPHTKKTFNLHPKP